MSLIVSPYIRTKELAITFKEEVILAPYNDLFGIEVWRFKVWGSKTIEELGCTILPTLKKSDIYAEGKDLVTLESELRKIMSELDEVSRKLSVDKEPIEFRLGNALEAIRATKKYPNGGVYIG